MALPAPQPSNDPTLCVVYDYLRSGVGDPVVGALGSALVTGGQVLQSASDVNGLITWALPRNARVTFSIPHILPSTRRTVPDAGVARLFDLPM